VPAKAPKVFIWGACEACGTTAVLEPHRDGDVSRQICATCAEGIAVRGRRAGTSKRFSPRDGGASTPSVPENARRGTHA
jgi:hypothetical protein